MGILERIFSILSPKTDTSPRRYRTCDYCGKGSLGPYTDREWDALGRMCEECEYAEMADGTLW